MKPKTAAQVPCQGYYKLKMNKYKFVDETNDKPSSNDDPLSMEAIKMKFW